MALALAEALTEASKGGKLKPETVEPEIRKHFIRWNHSPDNTRAPGMTCMNACDNLEKNIRWQDATVKKFQRLRRKYESCTCGITSVILF